MAAASTWSSRTMRTRLPSRVAPGSKPHVMANVWMHNGFLQVEGEKMSKSLGNFLTIRQLLERLAGRGAAPQHAEDPLPPADRLHGEGSRRWPGRRSTAGTRKSPPASRLAGTPSDSAGRGARRRPQHGRRRSLSSTAVKPRSGGAFRLAAADGFSWRHRRKPGRRGGRAAEVDETPASKRSDRRTSRRAQG